MNFQDFFNSVRGMNSERTFGRAVILVLLASNLLLVLAVANKKPVVTMTLPELKEEATISANQASESYRKAFGLFVANLVGNVSPGNVQFVEKSLEGLLAPDLYHQMLSGLHEQARIIEENHLALSFVPTGMFFQASKNKVFVTGDATKQGPFGAPETAKHTYEIEVKVVNYRPVVSYLANYPGGPKIDRNPAGEEEVPPQQEETKEMPE